MIETRSLLDVAVSNKCRSVRYPEIPESDMEGYPIRPGQSVKKTISDVAASGIRSLQHTIIILR